MTTYLAVILTVLAAIEAGNLALSIQIHRTDKRGREAKRKIKVMTEGAVARGVAGGIRRERSR